MELMEICWERSNKGGATIMRIRLAPQETPLVRGNAGASDVLLPVYARGLHSDSNRGCDADTVARMHKAPQVRVAHRTVVVEQTAHQRKNSRL